MRKKIRKLTFQISTKTDLEPGEWRCEHQLAGINCSSLAIIVFFLSIKTYMLDSIGALASLLSTYYFIRLNSKAWVFSLAATCLNGWLYWQKGIYADMLLESFYFITTCYGWLLWRQPVSITQSCVTRLSFKQWILLALSTSLLFIIIKTLLLSFTHSSVANLDALTTALSLVAQWLMCRKVIATWALWFITDVIYVYLYWHKQIPIHALLMLVYTGMAILGYYNWLRQLPTSLGLPEGKLGQST